MMNEHLCLHLFLKCTISTEHDETLGCSCQQTALNNKFQKSKTGFPIQGTHRYGLFSLGPKAFDKKKQSGAHTMPNER